MNAVTAGQRYTRYRRCPICDGAESDPRGQARRCIGYVSADGGYARCSREEYAGSAPLDEASDCWLHKLHGECRCGVAHGDAPMQEAPRSRDEKLTDGTRAGHTITAKHLYRDEKDRVLYANFRYEPKTFRQLKPAENGLWYSTTSGVRRVLYKLPELLAAKRSEPVFAVEGEKDVETLLGLGLVATSSKTWGDEVDQCAAAIKGRRVVVIPDDDSNAKEAKDRDKGKRIANAFAEAARKHAAAVVIAELPGVKPGQDVTDWIGSGGTVEQLRALAPDAGPTAQFEASTTRLDGERAERMSLASRIVSYGVKFLDDATLGILPGDVVMVGAKTGVGKTALATIAALENCKRGKRVHAFFLEAKEREIERRMKFQIIADLYYANGGRRDLRYLDWFTGRSDPETLRYEAEADRRLSQYASSLHTFYRYSSFTAADFVREADAVKGETDLIILDHLHFVDAEDDNENRAQKQIVKRISDWANKSLVPVMVVVHLRKTERRFDRLIPDTEDIHGSSDISKIATRVVMMAPAFDQPKDKPHLWPTYVALTKCREDGSLTRHVALCTYNARMNGYAREYELGRLTDMGQAFTPLTGQEEPSWYSGRMTTESPPPVYTDDDEIPYI